MSKTLNNIEWKNFQLEKLFKVSGSKTTPKNMLEKIGTGIYPYVTTQTTSNGQAGYFKIFTEQGNVLTVDSAVAGFCTFQSTNFTASDHVEILTPKFKMNRYIALFLTVQINKNNKEKFSYGYKACQDRLKEMSIMLPVNSKGEPDYKFMEEYIREREEKLKQRYKEQVLNSICELNEELKLKDRWKDFALTDIFMPEKGNQNNMSSLAEGDLPLVSAKKVDNGYKMFATKMIKKLFQQI